MIVIDSSFLSNFLHATTVIQSQNFKHLSTEFLNSIERRVPWIKKDSILGGIFLRATDPYVGIVSHCLVIIKVNIYETPNLLRHIDATDTRRFSKVCHEDR